MRPTGACGCKPVHTQDCASVRCFSIIRFIINRISIPSARLKKQEHERSESQRRLGSQLTIVFEEVRTVMYPMAADNSRGHGAAGAVLGAVRCQLVRFFDEDERRPLHNRSAGANEGDIDIFDLALPRTS